jgi:hypothetical protein
LVNDQYANRGYEDLQPKLPMQMDSFANEEEPKVAFTRIRKRAVQHCLCQLPSMTITLGILSLSFGSTFWQEPDRYTNTVLSLLQYAAKIHEALIYMSLTDIILLRIRYDMAGNLGVPFGLLTSGMQLSSLTFLSTANFISGAFASIQHCRRHFGLIALFSLTMFFGATAGPASAIVMIPRLNWWYITDSYQDGLGGTAQVYLNLTEGPVYLIVVSAAYAPP